ncbi:unnamed protein product [Acanthoscelides obtectus]|uniref:Cilia- and flagella-associated protein 45 n=1 Tax=Acanthoscelides obtectus TaxID=200917 RepID=A0A9P0LQV2_ACAOB|nr:unnamed protein product [Acanthoscelides obtectus]CAK1675157.1 Cilia- and flagella-associated protein 45 [Acanthoscelides obtectus]
MPPTTTGKFHSRTKPFKQGGHHSIEQCPQKVNGQYIHNRPQKATEGKPVVKLYDQSGQRELIIPNRSPIDRPVVVPDREFDRLKKQSTVITLQDKIAMLEAAEREKSKLQMESVKRKEALHKAQKIQKAAPGSKLDTAETQAADKNLYLLNRSKELLIEQDDRVKNANRVILATKCRAIRRAQIEEKELIARQLREEEMRLDMMMEQRRQKLMSIEEKKREEEEKKKKQYVSEVTRQIKENEIGRLLEAEKIEEESKMLNRALIALQKEEEEKQKRRYEAQQKIRKEFAKADAEVQHYKKLREEENKIAAMRIEKFMREKQEREEAREKEQEAIKVQKEKEIAAMRAAQEKAMDSQAMMDELNAMRWQEEKEREWREQEKAKARKRQQALDDLRVARRQQIEDIRKAQAVALARDEEDFKKVATVQKELHEKDKEKQRKKKAQIENHRKELLKQINEKERERIYYQQEKFEDGTAQRLEIEIRDRNVEEYLKNKVKGLKDMNIPEKYVADIERQLKLKK